MTRRCAENVRPPWAAVTEHRRPAVPCGPGCQQSASFQTREGLGRRVSLCDECDAGVEYEYSQNMLTCSKTTRNITSPDAPTTKWILSDKCQNCMGSAPVAFTLDDSGSSAATQPAESSGSKDSSKCGDDHGSSDGSDGARFMV